MKSNLLSLTLKMKLMYTYTGAIPNLFEEGKGVVAEGFCKR